MFYQLAIVKNVTWFDNTQTEHWIVLERISGWKETNLSICDTFKNGKRSD